MATCLYKPYRRKQPVPINVLFFVISNPVNPITVDFFHRICSPNGQILRIIIFGNNGDNALVEFDTVDTARKVKHALRDDDLYSDCCKLRIEFARTSKLNLRVNDMYSWDYTSPGLSGGPNASYMNYNLIYCTGNQNGPPLPSAGDNVTERHLPPAVDNIVMRHMPGIEPWLPGPSANEVPQPKSGCVFLAYGLDPIKANADKLFNLFCLYGNVERVKFSKDKRGSASVQMGDRVSAERCIQHLKHVPIFSGTLRLRYLNQTSIGNITNPYILPDNTTSFKDYSGCKNNRFLNAINSSRNRIGGPTKVLHFYNTPVGIREDQLNQVFTVRKVNLPIRIGIYHKKWRSSGWLKFEDVADAVDALVHCNYTPINILGSITTYSLRLGFHDTTK